MTTTWVETATLYYDNRIDRLCGISYSFMQSIHCNMISIIVYIAANCFRWARRGMPTSAYTIQIFFTWYRVELPSSSVNSIIVVKYYACCGVIRWAVVYELIMTTTREIFLAVFACYTSGSDCHPYCTGGHEQLHARFQNYSAQVIGSVRIALRNSLHSPKDQSAQ